MNFKSKTYSENDKIKIINPMDDIYVRLDRLEEKIFSTKKISKDRKTPVKRVIPKGYITISKFVEEYGFAGQRSLRRMILNHECFFDGYIYSEIRPIRFDSYRMVEAFLKYTNPRSGLCRTLKDYSKWHPELRKLCKKINKNK